MTRMRRRWRRGERGAVLVELTIVTPLLMMVLLGMFEIGQAWRANQTVVQAARSGARTVTQLGQYGGADQQAVLAVRATFGADAGDIERIIVFQADSNGDMPSACGSVVAPATAPSGVECNVYGPADIADADNPLRFDQDGSSIEGCGTMSANAGRSGHWCPSERNNVQLTADYVGVFVEFKEQYTTGFFGSGEYTITETTVMRVEPDAG